MAQSGIKFGADIHMFSSLHSVYVLGVPCSGNYVFPHFDLCLWLLNRHVIEAVVKAEKSLK